VGSISGEAPGSSTASDDADLQEVLITGQRRRPLPSPVRTSHLVVLSTSGRQQLTGIDSIFTTAIMTGAAAPEPTSSEPIYEARLTKPVISRHIDELLSVVVSTHLTRDALRQLIENHIRSAVALGGPQKGSDSESSPVGASGKLETADWSQFKYVLARIQCPAFIACTQQAPQSRNNDPLIWDWPLSAKQWDDNYTGDIVVTFFGDQTPTGIFGQSIAAMPPLRIAVGVNRDLTFWANVAKQLADLLTQTKSILITIGAIVAILVGWKTKIWNLFKHK
jgi:hypothetical protein